ncbi:Aste57867_13599 [Aphanomyces stellatus]|uniref:Aste57867_13599 protein n=1 Tax=Aphanomyces stellatus TaxID=120398 RepID=A0A485KYK0_9STRA|nr:hypothetical protein As57867_013549 [Aphanomyces stellatus]VFT90436.1 Aste57867_13599 [Aphanomyces stellatus]
MTTGLTLQHLYSQQQQQHQYSQQQQQPPQPPSSSSMSSHPQHGGAPNNGHHGGPQRQQLPSNAMNKQPLGQPHHNGAHHPGNNTHHHHHNGNHHHHMNNHHNGHNGGNDNEAAFVADPLPFNYEDIEATGVFDNDRYRQPTNGMTSNNVRPSSIPSDKSNNTTHHGGPPQPPMRYGSLLSGMQQSPYATHDAYNDGNSSGHHNAYDNRRGGDLPPSAMDRKSDNSNAPPSYHYMPHSHAHSDHDARPSTSHYGIPELHSAMGGGGGGSSLHHPLYHQSSGPPSYGNPPSHNSHSYSALMDNHHGAPSVPKKDMPPTYHGDYLDSRSHLSTSMGASSSGSSIPHAPSSASALSHLSSSGGVSGPSQTQEAVIKIKTSLKNKYWRNGRRNLQCFPSCKVFGDYSQIKIEDLKQHDFMWGKCRGSLIAEVTLNSNATFDDILLLGRVHSLDNIPVPFDEAVIRECMIGRVVEPDLMDSMKESWIAGERLPDFINQNNNMACYEFKPKVWKYTDDMIHGKCKRRNVRYYVQFEAFVPVLTGDRRCYVCIGSGMSSSFEVGSSRVLARQKRKATNGGDDDDDEKDSNEDFENDAGNGRPSKKAATASSAVHGYPI